MKKALKSQLGLTTIMFPTLEEIRRILSATKSPYERAIIQFLIHHGTLSSEFHKIDVKSIIEPKRYLTKRPSTKQYRNSL